MKYPHQDLAQQIADYWASPDEANQKIGFVILKSQTRYWRAEKRKELINTALCLCWDKPELLEFLDFEKRKNETILRHIKAIDAAEWKNKIPMIKNTVDRNLGFINNLYLSDRTIKVGCFSFEIYPSTKDTRPARRIIDRITPTLIAQCFVSGNFDKANQIVDEFKGFLPNLFSKENTNLSIDIFAMKRLIWFDLNAAVYPEAIDWRSPSKITQYFAEVVYNNLDKLAE